MNLKKKNIGNSVINIHLSTQKRFNPKKNGHAYATLLRYDPTENMFDRSMWINSNPRFHNKNHTRYFVSFDFLAHEGMIIECRLKSRKIDLKEYYIVKKKKKII